MVIIIILGNIYLLSAYYGPGTRLSTYTYALCSPCNLMRKYSYSHFTDEEILEKGQVIAQGTQHANIGIQILDYPRQNPNASLVCSVSLCF